jgi:FKBP-type peptidyl-prolyl cis-trans isomerase
MRTGVALPLLAALALSSGCSCLRAIFQCEPPNAAQTEPAAQTGDQTPTAQAGDDAPAPDTQPTTDELWSWIRADDPPAPRSTEQRDDVAVETLRVGEGPSLTAGDAATVRYRATLSNGDIIDESIDQPSGPWRLSSLTEGLRTGMLGMRPGALRRITVPPGRAYADEPVTSPETGETIIPAGSTIIYIVELISIEGS